MKVRQIEANFHHTETNRKEVLAVTCWFTDRNEQYELTKVWVVEFNAALLFDKNTNTFLVPD